jgi:hypothetical protein
MGMNISASAGSAPPMEHFDPRSGSLVERALFNHRWLVVLLCGLVTALLWAGRPRGCS